jgi:two-component system phosphate regulon response regulator PhoB
MSEDSAQHRVLVVDDDPRLIHIVRLYLESEGYLVGDASNGADALALMPEFRPELVILDIMMAGMNGVEVCERIRANPETATLPVLMFSALSTHDDVERARAAGATHLITKPYSLEGLGKVVESAIARHAAATAEPTS